MPSAIPFSAISIIIPVYNEAAALPDLIQRWIRVLSQSPIREWEWIFIDDGSSDGGFEALKLPLQARLIRHATNQGYGASLKTGIRAARYPVVLICDADGTYEVEALPRLLAAYTDSSLVVAERKEILYRRYRGLKRLARGLMHLWLSLLTYQRINDFNSGLRLFSRERVLPLLPNLSNRFSFTTSQTLLWIYGGHPVVYVPTEYRQRVGESKVHYFWDGVKMIRLTLRLTARNRPLRLIPPALLVTAVAATLGILWR